MLASNKLRGDDARFLRELLHKTPVTDNRKLRKFGIEAVLDTSRVLGGCPACIFGVAFPGQEACCALVMGTGSEVAIPCTARQRPDGNSVIFIRVKRWRND